MIAEIEWCSRAQVVGGLLQRQRLLEQLLRRRVTQLRDQRRAAADLHVALADLLGVVEGVGVEEGPERVARHAVDRELEVRVLVDGVVAGREDVLRQLVASVPGPGALLLFRQPVTADLLGVDDPLPGVAGARRGDRIVQRARVGVDQPHRGRGRTQAERGEGGHDRALYREGGGPVRHR